jgi:hypothetical protein
MIYLHHSGYFSLPDDVHRKLAMANSWQWVQAPPHFGPICSKIRVKQTMAGEEVSKHHASGIVREGIPLALYWSTAGNLWHF